jgi:serine/threonine protein kinase
METTIAIIETELDGWLVKIEKKYGDRRSAEFKKERPQLREYVRAILDRTADTYGFEKALAVGGTGVVLTGKHKRFNQPVALKFNRPNTQANERSMVANEASVLPNLTHPNIISVLDIGERDDLKPTLTYLIEPFITGSKPFFSPDKDRVEETWLRCRVNSIKNSLPDLAKNFRGDDPGKTVAAVSELLGELTSLFSQWASLLAHVHSGHASAPHGYVFLDVKPENVLVDEHNHLTSIDYGSVEYVDTDDPSSIEVFFTERYAHPFFSKKKVEKPSANRVRGAIRREDVKPAFDYYALGTSILEILNEVASIRPHLVPQLPLYRSLHFLATRLLDGKNAKPEDDHYEYAPQIFPGLQDADYSSLAYIDLADTYRDLQKERGQWNLEDRVPELATYSKDIVRLVPGFNTVLTARLRGVIEHPLVGRLKYVSQLGLVSLVYPTADHARYDHALGAYTYTTNYVKSLFNDLGNPIFRNLVSVEDLNAVLLAALLHDLGQYPLAHDLEEVHDGIFKHGRIGIALLEDNERDQRGRTLLQIITDPENGWGVPEQALRRILGAHSKNIDLQTGGGQASLKIDVLAAIIDGPVDADKADYIIRDSSRCELPYGSQLDIERLLRVLTVAIIPNETLPMRRVTLGVYDKGLVSAHAFGLSRYELLSTVYWHHTARIVKCMLQYATALGLPPEVYWPNSDEGQNRESEIRARLVEFLKALVPPFAVQGHYAINSAKEARRRAVDLGAEVLDDALAATGEASNAKAQQLKKFWYPGVAWTDWLMLEWIANLPSACTWSRNLIRGIQGRRLYKRVATWPRGGAHDDIIRALEELNWPGRLDLCKELQKRVLKKLKQDWGGLSTATALTQDEFDELCAANLLIVIDVPLPKKKIGYDRPLGVVPELKEKSYHQDSRQATEDRKWRETMETMIDGIAPVRILCHPDVRNLVSASYKPVDVGLAKVLRDLLGLTQ